MNLEVGFVVIYRWRLHADKALQFQQAWERGTRRIAAQRGGLGSRLHQAEDGGWLAYAQWPDRAAWQRSRELGPVNAADTALMEEAIIEAFLPLPLEIVSDLLLSG